METAPHAPLAERYLADPARAAVTVRVATALGDDGMRCETTARGHTVAADEPRAFGGGDSAQSPVELLMSSLATCQAITYRLWAAELGVALGSVAVEVEGDIDLRGFLGLADVPAGFGAIRVRVTLEGPAGADRYRELAEVVDRHCPVVDVLARPVPVARELVTPAS